VDLTAGVTPRQEQQVSVLRGAEFSLQATTAATGLPRPVVKAIESKPANRELIQATRAMIQRNELRGINRNTRGLYAWLGEVVAAKDSAELTRLTSGLLRIEKIASSAAGEARRVESTITQTIDHTVDVNLEAKLLLATLMGINDPPK
jgi:hypothetical protein